MILTKLEQMADFKKGDILFIAPTPQMEIWDCMFTFNLTATLNIYYPINQIQKVAEVDIMYEQIESNTKTSYLHEMDEIYQDLRDYEGLHTHKFIIGTDEREVLKAWESSVFSFMETIKRTTIMADRFKNDFDSAPFIVEHKENFPEDWI